MLSIRNIGVIGRTYRHLNRYRQILGVFLKYGFGDLLNTLKIDQYIEVGLQMISRKTAVREERLTRPQRVRLALEELGPTYIKLGQILSTRPDLIPAEFVDELALLQDAVPPFDFSAAEALIRQEFGVEPAELFERITPEPVASASIGQVHRAVLKSGEPVAVKFRRPGIQELIEVDLEIMLHLATLAERHVEELAPHRPVKIVEEFARTLEKEIDFKIEAANIERIAGDGSRPEVLRITLAVAGFTRDDLDVSLEDKQLIVRGKAQDEKERDYLYRGIAARQFSKAFLLADGIEVRAADLQNGLLSIDLVRHEPERFVRKIEIGAEKKAR